MSTNETGSTPDLGEFLKNHPIPSLAHPSDKVYSQEQQNVTAQAAKEALEKVLGVGIEGFLFIPLREDGVVSILASIPEDPVKTVRLARAASTAVARLLQ